MPVRSHLLVRLDGESCENLVVDEGRISRPFFFSRAPRSHLSPTRFPAVASSTVRRSAVGLEGDLGSNRPRGLRPPLLSLGETKALVAIVTARIAATPSLPRYGRYYGFARPRESGMVDLEAVADLTPSLARRLLTPVCRP